MFLSCNICGWPGLKALVNHASVATRFPLFEWAFDTPVSSAPPIPDGDADNDAAMLVAAAGGSAGAWQQLFDRWKKPLLSFFYRSLGSMPEAEDLTLEVFVRLHRAAGRYEQRGSFSTFIFHIARNLLLNELRRRRRKPAQLLPPEAFDYLASSGTDDARRLAELEEIFQQALAQLPEAQRTLLLLIQQQGLEHTAAASTLGITENALRVQLHRARQRLRELMSQRS